MLADTRTLGIIDPRMLGRERRFFAVMAILALATVFAGFAPSYYLWPLTHVSTYPSGLPVSQSLSPVVHIHAVVFSAWIVLFGIQTGLVAAGKVAIHRRLGVTAVGLIPAMLVLGVVTAIRGARDGWNPGGPYPDALGFMVVGIADMFVFTMLAGLGLYFRRRTDTHRRLMLYATLGGLMWPAITRTWFLAPRFPIMFSFLAALLLAPVVRDFWVGSRGRWISASSALAILATFPLRAAIGGTGAWHDFAAWLIR